MTATTMPKKRDVSKLKDSTFIQQLKANHYVIMPKELLFGYEELSMQEKLFYGYLLHYANISIVNDNFDAQGNPMVYPSQGRLAKEMGVSQPTVSRYVKKLEKSGLVDIKIIGNGSTNWVSVLPPTYSQMNKTYAPMNGIAPETYSSMNTIKERSNKKEKERQSATAPSKLSKPSKKNFSTEKSVQDIIDENMSRSPKKKESTMPKQPKRMKDARNSKTMLEYFQSRYEQKFNDNTPLTTGKDLSLFKRMIEHYGYEKVLEFVDFTCDYYDTFRREKGLNGNPTVGMIWGFRSYLEEKVEIYYGEGTKDVEEPKQEEGLGEESAW